MGTRCITHVKDEDGRVLVSLYRQFDGYPDGHGAELKEFLEGKKIINGIGRETLAEAFNGAGCLAAALVAYFKREIGGFYIVPPGSEEAQYIYVVSPGEDGKIEMTVTGRLTTKIHRNAED